MQQIERYGVIALVFLLVTIVAISFWGDSKSPGFWKRLTGQGQAKPEQVAKLDAPVVGLPPQIADPKLPLSPAAPTPEPQQVPGLGLPNPPTSIDRPTVGAGSTNAPGFVPETTAAPTPGGSIAPPLVLSTPLSTPLATPAAGRSEYVVQRGDSLARIARTKLGAESRWQEIAALNPRIDPMALSVGATILLPDGAARSASGPVTLNIPRAPEAKSPPSKKPTTPAVAKKSSSSRSCTVQKGDTLRSIARRELGDEKRWKEIAGVNPGVDPARLAIGQRLKLPSSAGGELMAAVPAASTNASGPRVR